MRIDSIRRSRAPGVLALFFNICALALVIAMIGLGEGTMSSATSSVMQVAGIRSSGGAGGIFVDSKGQIRYRSRSVALEDLAGALQKDLRAGGKTVSVTASTKADAARVAQVLRAAGSAGAQSVRLGTTQE